MSLTEYVAGFTVGLDHDDVPASVRATAVDHVLDGYGLALSGVVEESHRLTRLHLEAVSCAGEVTVLGTRLRSAAELAARAGGLAMHAMDFDDTQLSTDPESVYGLLTHPTAPVLGAASAAAELVGASGRDLLTAYVAGVEVACRTADASRPRHYQDGFHSTGTFGALGAAAAAGKLLGLTAEQLRHAFGVAASMSGGYRESFGTMTKPLHAGRAAEAGVLAARLARSGFTAATTILEAPRGMYAAASGGFEPARIEGRLGSPFFFAAPGVSIKPYPSGSLSHPGQDAVLDLVREHDVRPEDVVEIVAGTNAAMPSALIHRTPRTALEAKFSFPFLLAIAVLRRKVGIAEFSDEVVGSPEVQDMVRRCHHVVDEEMDSKGFQHMNTRITIRLADGRVLERVEAFATGHPEKPMSRDRLEAKFAECAGLVLDEKAVRRTADVLWDLDGLDDVRELHRTLVPTP